MRERTRMSTRRAVALVAGLGVAMTLTAAACGGSGGGGSSSPPASSVPAAVSTPTTTQSTTTTTTTTSDGGLSGKWTGAYSGTFDGTFVLNWTQSGSALSGTIKLSTGGTDNVNGTVDGSSIKFGTVGGDAVHYTGSVSGDSMSGSYSTAAGGGSWSAHKA
ncbi:MAG TPA: hypothetical protein VN615_18800 [Gaiellales bacterium]|nr:hypothetical protein [Gaiellales bacterium]